MLKIPMLLNDCKHQAGGELANSLKSCLQDSEHGFQRVGKCKNE